MSRVEQRQKISTEGSVRFGLSAAVWMAAVESAVASALDQGLPVFIEDEAVLASVAQSLHCKLGGPS